MNRQLKGIALILLGIQIVLLTQTYTLPAIGNLNNIAALILTIVGLVLVFEIGRASCRERV